MAVVALDLGEDTTAAVTSIAGADEFMSPMRLVDGDLSACRRSS